MDVGLVCCGPVFGSTTASFGVANWDVGQYNAENFSALRSVVPTTSSVILKMSADKFRCDDLY